jgi:hypothetical protein
MRKVLFPALSLILACSLGNHHNRQANADCLARREALIQKAGGGVSRFSPPQAGDAEYGFRQNHSLYDLSGVTEPGVARG